MKHRILCLALGALALTAGSVASARVHLSIGFNPYGYGAYAPGVVYQPDSYYYAPPVVYYGGDSWGDSRWRHSRDHRYDRYRRGHDDRHRGDQDHRH